MKAMILAAGRGERMGSLTVSTPKPLLKAGNKTVIEYNLMRLRTAGITEVIINVSWLGSQIIDYLGDGTKFDLNITFINEGSVMLGTGGGILNALDHLGEKPFWLINADVYSDFKIVNGFTLDENKLGHLFLVQNPIHHPKGDFGLRMDEVTINRGQNPYTFSGMSVLSSRLFEGCFKETFALEPLLKKKVKEGYMAGELINDYWSDIGTAERLIDLQKRLENENLLLSSNKKH
jgi:N-acetyl-alpha-D-muramate 1-phosphate uridylyltransferase